MLPPDLDALMQGAVVLGHPLVALLLGPLGGPPGVPGCGQHGSHPRQEGSQGCHLVWAQGSLMTWPGLTALGSRSPLSFAISTHLEASPSSLAAMALRDSPPPKSVVPVRMVERPARAAFFFGAGLADFLLVT